jgi:uncharacterized protein
VRIVADTNVLVAALLTPGGGPGALLAAVDAGEMILVAAPGLLDELGEVLARDRFRIWVSTEQVETYLDTIRNHAELVDDPDEVTPVSRDPDDDYLIALARAAHADALVTGDEDLTSLELADLAILTPRQVLDRLS